MDDIEVRGEETNTQPNNITLSSCNERTYEIHLISAQLTIVNI